ncbi:MAG: hypothetical protein J5486_04135 [Bacteroidaceae bacterium]|nr:hypothetical protein [Bacteroidaceae bacterium]
MDEILEMQIKFREQILREYLRLSELSKANKRQVEQKVDELLDELQKLYKQRGNDK